MCFWWQQNNREKVLKTNLHTFKKAENLKPLELNFTKTVGHMEIFINVPFVWKWVNMEIIIDWLIQKNFLK